MLCRRYNYVLTVFNSSSLLMLKETEMQAIDEV